MSLRALVFKPRIRRKITLVLKHLPLQMAYYFGGRGLRPISAYCFFDVPERGPAYLALVARKKKNIAELVRLDDDLRKGRLNVRDMYDSLSSDTRSNLFTCPIQELSTLSKSFNRVGLLRLAGFIRAITLVRTASDAIRKGTDRVDGAVIVEISYNDFCDHILSASSKSTQIDLAGVRRAVASTRRLELEKKVNQFKDTDHPEHECIIYEVKGAKIVLQGPSKRSSDLEHTSDDLIAVVGNVDSLPESVRKAHFLFLAPHNIVSLKKNNAGQKLCDLKWITLSKKWAHKEKRDSAEFIKKQAQIEKDLKFTSRFCPSMVSNVRSAYLESAFNSGSECFLFFLTLRPVELKVRHVDLFLNPFYRDGHSVLGQVDVKLADGWRYSDWHVLKFFGYHEPAQQFSVYKAFLEYPEVKYDSFLKDIVSSPLSEYLAKLEETYRPSAV